jgi:putative oxidoreductase
MDIAPIFAPYANVALLILRVMIALVFGSSGWSHVTNLEARAKSIGMNKGFTLFLGTAELAGAAGILTGVLARWAAIGLILIMLGAIQKKIFVWKTGFWGQGSQGWHYDLLFVVTNLVILCVGPGSLIIPILG